MAWGYGNALSETTYGLIVVDYITGSDLTLYKKNSSNQYVEYIFAKIKNDSGAASGYSRKIYYVLEEGTYRLESTKGSNSTYQNGIEINATIRSRYVTLSYNDYYVQNGSKDNRIKFRTDWPCYENGITGNVNINWGTVGSSGGESYVPLTVSTDGTWRGACAIVESVNLTNWNYLYFDASFELTNINSNKPGVWLCVGHKSDPAAIYTSGQAGYYPQLHPKLVDTTSTPISRPSSPYKLDLTSITGSYDIYLYMYVSTGASGTKSIKANIFNWYLSKT